MRFIIWDEASKVPDSAWSHQKIDWPTSKAENEKGVQKMLMVRETDDGLVRHYEIDGSEVVFSGESRSEAAIRHRKPRVWRYGQMVEKSPTEVYPMLCKPGFSAAGRSVAECLSLIEKAKADYEALV